MSYEVKDFETEIIEASKTKPVLVDFWAPWCGPCRLIGPVLEKMAAEADGQWNLVKVNVDNHQQLAMEYGVRGIPAVQLFVNGKVADGFVGALPEFQIRSFLERALPAPSAGVVTEAGAALESGDRDKAISLLRTAVESKPDDTDARTALARLLVFEDPGQANALVANVEVAEPSAALVVNSIRTVAAKLDGSFDPAALPDEPGKDKYVEATQSLRSGDLDAAIKSYIEVINTNRFYDDDGARRIGVALFTLLGDESPITRRHRRTFDMALY